MRNELIEILLNKECHWQDVPPFLIICSCNPIGRDSSLRSYVLRVRISPRAPIRRVDDAE